MRHVLVVDDEAPVCEIITEMLQEWGPTSVTCAHDGTTAVQLLRERQFDLALIDGALQGLSGLQLAAIAADQNTPVLVLSGHPDINQAAVTFGFPHLAKPFPIAALLQRASDAAAQAHDNVARVKAAVARLQASGDTGRATAAEPEAPADESPPPPAS